jgi:integrase
VYEKEPKTKTSKRTVPIPAPLLEDLKKYYHWFEIADVNFKYKLDTYYLASTIYRTPICPTSLRSWLTNFEKRHGFKHISCHGLRHTYCSILLSQNVPIQTVSRYMGHSDSTITLEVYSHFIPDTQERALTALDNITG